MTVDFQRAHGVAIYLEYRRGTYTHQFVITPELVEPRTQSIVPVTLITRMVSKVNPQRQWRPKVASSEATSGSLSDLSLVAEEPLGTLLMFANTVLLEFAIYTKALYSAGWTMILKPVMFEVSTEDTVALHRNQVPKRLLARMMRARREAGYPEGLYEGAAADAIDEED